MTKEKAVEHLKADIKYWENTSVSVDHLYMAIKALEQQPCDDCVSREQALLQLTGVNLSDKTTEELIGLFDRRIKSLPPVTPAQSWIPIERRDLTQEEKELYSSLYGEEPEYMIESRMPDDGEEVLVSAGGIVFKDFFSHHDFDFENISVDEIDAWMPLPKPYEEKRGNKYGSN